MLREMQASFRQELLEGNNARAARHVAIDEIPAGRRLGVYRNNILGSLVEVVAAAYPATSYIAGETLFRRMALAFIREHPPRRPQLLAYGGAFPAFLDLSVSLPEALAHLPDLARLEWARNEAYFAADATTLRPEALAAIPLNRYGHLRFRLHPSARLLKLRFPVLATWQCAQQTQIGSWPTCPEPAGEHVIVVRPGLIVQHRAIDAAGFLFLSALNRGETLETAASSVLAVAPDFDLQQCLAGSLTGRLFVAAEPGDGLGRRTF